MKMTSVERIQIKTHPIIKRQPKWIRDFLKAIHLPQDRESKSLLEMRMTKVESNQGELFLEIPLFKSKNYEKQVQKFHSDKIEDELYSFRRIILQLWISEEHLKFCWTKDLYSNSDAYDPEDRIKELIDREKLDDFDLLYQKHPKFNFHEEVEGICIEKNFRITNSTSILFLKAVNKSLKSTMNFVQYPEALRNLIEGLLNYIKSWQRYYFNWKLRLSWEPLLDGPQDFVLVSSFDKYIKEFYEEEFLVKELLQAPKLIYIQVLEYSNNEIELFKIIKKSLFEYKESKGKWPKDLLEVLLFYYKRNFSSSPEEFEEHLFFIMMRHFYFPFIPEIKDKKTLYEKIAEERPDIEVEELTEYREEFKEWTKWVMSHDSS
jgi:hypothetical protein